MMSYTATAERGRRAWVVQCDQAPGALSEVKQLAQAADAIREAIAFVQNVPVRTVDVTVRTVFPPEIEQQLEQTRQLRREAARASELASQSLRTAAHELQERGWTMRDIGTALEVSHQRAHQLVSRSPAARGSRRS